MANILIVYATTDGQTGKIAKHMAAQFSLRGHQAHTCDLTGGEQCPPLENFDGVMIGAPVRYGRYHRKMQKFLATHAEHLSRMPHTAFFSVSGAAASAEKQSQALSRQYMSDLESRFRWHPALDASFAGAVKYTHYNPMLRWVMKRISEKTGRETDTSRDFEYTDWCQVDSFVERFSGSM